MIQKKINLKTEDGLKLSAWYIPAGNKNDKAIIFLHGYPADKGDILSWADFLRGDYNLLFFDFRYFGQSEGSFTSLGYHEREDVISAINFLKKEGIANIGLMGFSFGASVALLTLPETFDVKAVVADSAFANLDLMAKGYYQNIGFLEKPVTALTKFWGRLLYGIDTRKITPEEAIKDTKVPIFIIHSRQDNVVLVENAKRLQSALSKNSNAITWIYDRGVHGELGSRVYEGKIKSFFEKNLR